MSGRIGLFWQIAYNEAVMSPASTGGRVHLPETSGGHIPRFVETKPCRVRGTAPLALKTLRVLVLL